MAKEKGIKKIRKVVSGSFRGSGTTYSCLYSTAKSPGVKYSTVKDRAKSIAIRKRKY